MKKFVTIASMLAILATAAFAATAKSKHDHHHHHHHKSHTKVSQSFNPERGTGNVLPGYYDPQGGFHRGLPPRRPVGNAAAAEGSDNEDGAARPAFL